MTKTRLILPLLAVLLFAAPARAALVEDLFVAVAGNDLAEAKVALDRGADVDKTGTWRRDTALHHLLADKTGIATAKILIEAGADANAVRRDETPLDVAIDAGHEKIAAYLKSRGAKSAADLKR